MTRRDRQRRYRKRRRSGIAVYPVEINGDVVAMLVRLRWLSERDVHDKDTVARAIAALLADTAKRI